MRNKPPARASVGGEQKGAALQPGAASQEAPVPSTTPSPPRPLSANASGAERKTEAAAAEPVSPPWAQRLAQGASRLQALNPVLRRSEALSQAIQNLSQSIGEGDPRWQDLAARAARLQGTFEDLKQRLQLGKMDLAGELSWPSRLPHPSLPSVHWADATPALSPGVTPPPAANRWPALLGLIGLGVVAALLWRLQSQARKAAREPAEWRLGPWPVNPAAVATREEVVRAFEYLSLLRLGRAARTWNHRTIARQLARPSAERLAGQDRALPIEPGVQVLADVYEQARYAPSTEELSPGALAAVRTELCLLGGVSAS
jgi:hypothetical protein